MSAARCLHLEIRSSDGKTWHCAGENGCGAEMVVAPTIRAAWGAMGVRLQKVRGRRSESDPPGQETLHLMVNGLTL